MVEETNKTDDNKPKTWVRFKDHEPQELPNGKLSKPPASIDIGNGEYRRTFKASEQPFEVTLDEAQVLKNSGLFVDAAEPPIFGAPDDDVTTGEASEASKAPPPPPPDSKPSGKRAKPTV